MDPQNNNPTTPTTPSWMIYPDAAPSNQPQKSSRKWIILFAIAVLAAIALIVLFVIVYNRPPVEHGDDVTKTNDTGYYADEYVLKDAALGPAIWNAGQNGTSITSNQCKDLISAGNAFAKELGKEAMSDSVCNNATVKLTAKTIENDVYPYGDLKVIFMQTNDNCIKISFYEHLRSLKGFDDAGKKCPANYSEVEVKQ